VAEDLLTLILPPPQEPHKHNRRELSQTDCAIELLNDDAVISIDECFVALKSTTRSRILHKRLINISVIDMTCERQ